MSEERDYEKEARSEGWVPIDEWKGDPGKHVDAETFVRRGEEILPIVNAKNRRLLEQVEKLSGEVGELKLGNKQFTEFHNQFVKKAEQEAAQLRAQLEAKRQQAVTDGDGKAFTAADKQLRDLDSQEKTRRQETNGGQLQPHTVAFLEENPWYKEDRALRAMADGFADELARTQPHLRGSKAFFDELTKMVKEASPEKFENPNRETSPVGKEGKRGSSKGGRSFEDLPPEAQEAALRFEKTHGLSKEQYCKEYPWD